MQTAKLGTLVRIIGGGTPDRSNPEYWDGDIPWVTVKDVQSSRISSSQESITEKGLRNSASNLIPAGSIIVPTRMALGKVAINQVPIAINQDLKALTVQQDSVDRDYLHRFLLSKSSYLESRGKGATVKGITLDVLTELDVPLPSLPEQRRLAAILDKADAIRRKRREALKLADEFLRAAFLDMFGDPRTNSKGWPKVPLGSLCTIRRGASPRPINDFLGGSVPWIKIGDATNGDEVYITNTAEHVTEEGARRSVYLKPGAFVFANCGVSLGFARILKIGGCIHDGWLAFENISPRLDQFYLLSLINHLTPVLRSIAPDGTQPNLNTGIMKDFEIPIPTLDMQVRFRRLFERSKASKLRQATALTESEAFFTSLSHRAFQGTL